MADLRRRGLEPPPAARTSGSGAGSPGDTLRELAPVLAAGCIDVNDVDVPDLDTVQGAMNRAVARHNMALFAPTTRPTNSPSPRCARSSRAARTMSRSGPATCGMDLAHWLVEREFSRSLADGIATAMEYPRARPSQ
jgi:hypothetical protein